MRLPRPWGAAGRAPMKLSPLPELGSNRRLAACAVLVTLAVSAVLVWHDRDLVIALGDTDDALRLVLMRDLMAGRVWYDQWLGRLQPPLGLYMHWSRLLDGALAGFTSLWRLILPPAGAELATRLAWPLLWIAPAVTFALAIARRLGGGPAVFVAALLLVTNLAAYGQFRPGRVDHHNIQIVMALVALGCAIAPTAARSRWAVLGGVAAALGLAIGVEALAFQALVGAAYAVGFALDPRQARPARNYACALLLAILAVYALQTPPWRWSLAVCDALGLNLLGGVVVGAAGLAMIAHGADRLSAPWRLGLVALTGLAAASAYLALDPACLHGPFGAVDPRVRGFWFDHVQELQPWSHMLRYQRALAVPAVTVSLMGLVSALALIARARLRPDPSLGLAAGAVLLATVAAANANRMQDYAYWLGLPVIAAAIASLAPRRIADLLLPMTVLSLVLSPVSLAGAINAAIDRVGAKSAGPAAAPQIDPRCFQTPAYAPLAAQPPGLVLAEVDLGAFILANTPHSVLAAPYHRANWGILASHNALAAAPDQAEAQVRALKADYIVECPANALRVGPRSLEADLRRGQSPAWLQPLSQPSDRLQIYRVRPPSRSGPGG